MRLFLSDAGESAAGDHRTPGGPADGMGRAEMEAIEIMKKRFSILAAFFCAVLLAGCGGSDADAIHFGLITAGGEHASSAAAEEILRGIESYAGANGFTSKTYTAASADAEAIDETFKAASEEKVKYVIACGEEMEIPVYDAQKANRGTRYILFDGEPRKSAENESQIRKNTECISINKREMGFLAGYTAAREGYRNIAFISGANEGDTAEYFSGIKRGIGYAMNELMITSDQLTLSAEFAGSEDLSPRRTADALSLYAEGTEIILTDSFGIARSIDLAARQAGRFFATVGFDPTGSYERALYASVPDYANAIQKLLDESIRDNHFHGGEVYACGAAEGGIRLSTDFTRFTSYTEENASNVLGVMANGAYGTDSDESGEGEQLENLVTVREVSPVAPGDTSVGSFSAPLPPADSQAAESGAESSVTEAAGEDQAEDSGEQAEEYSEEDSGDYAAANGEEDSGDDAEESNEEDTGAGEEEGEDSSEE